MTKKTLRIAIFHLGFFFSGGGEKLVIKEALELEKLGHEVDVFAPVIDRKKCFPDLIKKIRLFSLFIPFSFYFPLRDFITITCSVFVTPLRFWRFLKYDVFIGANQPGPLICYFLSKIIKKPYLIYLAQPTRLIYPRKIDLERGFGKGSFNAFYLMAGIFRPLVIFLDRISIQGADKVLVNGAYMAGIIKKIYKVKVVVCPAGCAPLKKIIKYKKRLEGKISLKKMAVKKPFILFTNRHYPQKKFEHAIKIISNVKSQMPNVKLIITGEQTSYTNYLKSLVKQLKLQDTVKFVGLVSERQLAMLYSQTVLYLYTSPEEDFGMGIVEAMAAGAPVAAWNYGGPTMTVKNNKTGYLAKPYDLEDFAKKTLKLLKNHNLAASFGRAGWKRAFDFSYQKHSRILEKEIVKLI